MVDAVTTISSRFVDVFLSMELSHTTFKLVRRTECHGFGAILQAQLEGDVFRRRAGQPALNWKSGTSRFKIFTGFSLARFVRVPSFEGRCHCIC